MLALYFLFFLFCLIGTTTPSLVADCSNVLSSGTSLGTITPYGSNINDVQEIASWVKELEGDLYADTTTFIGDATIYTYAIDSVNDGRYVDYLFQCTDINDKYDIDSNAPGTQLVNKQKYVLCRVEVDVSDGQIYICRRASKTYASDTGPTDENSAKEQYDDSDDVSSFDGTNINIVNETYSIGDTNSGLSANIGPGTSVPTSSVPSSSIPTSSVPSSSIPSSSVPSSSVPSSSMPSSSVPSSSSPSSMPTSAPSSSLPSSLPSSIPSSSHPSSVPTSAPSSSVPSSLPSSSIPSAIPSGAPSSSLPSSNPSSIPSSSVPSSSLPTFVPTSRPSPITCPPGTRRGDFGLCYDCDPGTFNNETVTLLTPTTCIDCPYGYHSSVAGSATCLACGNGFYQDERGKLSCKTCPAGYQCPSGIDGVINPIICETGSFSASQAHICTPCDGGSYQDQQGQSTCLACPEGHYCALGSAVYTPCSVGTFSSAGSSLCSLCESGSFQDEQGRSSCKLCNSGTYQSLQGQDSCIECPAGSSCVQGSAMHNPCVVGTFTALSGQETCANCAMGEYQDSEGQLNCIECYEGFFSDRQGAELCDPCPLGFFTDSGGTVECAICPANFYNDNFGASACKTCPPFRISLPGTINEDLCINPVPNFVTGSLTLLAGVLVIIIYLFGGRFHRIAFLRRSRVNENIKNKTMIVNATLISRLREKIKIDSHRTKNMNEYVKKKQRKELIKSFLAVRYLYVILWMLICSIFVILSAGIAYIICMFHILFKGMIVYLSFDVNVGIQDFINKVQTFVSLFAITLHIPYVDYALYPFIFMLRLVSYLKIDLSAIEVTCVGAQAPLELFINCVIIGLVVCVVESNFQYIQHVMVVNMGKKMASVMAKVDIYSVNSDRHDGVEINDHVNGLKKEKRSVWEQFLTLQRRFQEWRNSKAVAKKTISHAGDAVTFVEKLKKIWMQLFAWRTWLHFFGAFNCIIGVITKTSISVCLFSYGCLRRVFVGIKNIPYKRLWNASLCTLFHVVLAINPLNEKVLQVFMSLLNFQTFTTKDGIFHDSTEACNQIEGMEGYDKSLALFSSVFMWIAFFPLVYTMSRVAVPHGEGVPLSLVAKKEDVMVSLTTENFATRSFRLLSFVSFISPDLWVAWVSLGVLSKMSKMIPKHYVPKRVPKKKKVREKKQKMLSLSSSDKVEEEVFDLSSLFRAHTEELEVEDAHVQFNFNHLNTEEAFLKGTLQGMIDSHSSDEQLHWNGENDEQVQEDDENSDERQKRKLRDLLGIDPHDHNNIASDGDVTTCTHCTFLRSCLASFQHIFKCCCCCCRCICKRQFMSFTQIRETSPLFSPFKSSLPEENEKYKTLERKTLPLYLDFCNSVHEECVDGILKYFGCPMLNKRFKPLSVKLFKYFIAVSLVPVVYIFPFAHGFTQTGLTYWYVVLEKYVIYFCVCVGVWNDLCLDGYGFSPENMITMRLPQTKREESELQIQECNIDDNLNAMTTQQFTSTTIPTGRNINDNFAPTALSFIKARIKKWRNVDLGWSCYRKKDDGNDDFESEDSLESERNNDNEDIVQSFCGPRAVLMQTVPHLIPLSIYSISSISAPLLLMSKRARQIFPPFVIKWKHALQRAEEDERIQLNQVSPASHRRVLWTIMVNAIDICFKSSRLAKILFNLLSIALTFGILYGDIFLWILVSFVLVPYLLLLNLNVFTYFGRKMGINDYDVMWLIKCCRCEKKYIDELQKEIDDYRWEVQQRVNGYNDQELYPIDEMYPI